MRLLYASEKEIDDVIDLRINYFRDTYINFSAEEENDLRKKLKEYFVNHLEKDCIVVLVKEGDCAVASAILNLFKKAPNRRNPNGLFAEIYGVYTLKEKRRKGYATLLVKELINYADKLNVSFIELEASKEGKGVYLNCGFQIVEKEYSEMKYYFND